MLDDDSKALALDHLRVFPLDHVGVARLLGVELNQFLEFRGLHINEFKQVEDESFSLLEHLCMMSALGQPLPEEYKDFDFAKAKWVLQCRKGWATTKNVRSLDDEKPKAKPNGYAEKLLDKHLTNPSLYDESDREGTILSREIRRKLQ